MSRRGHVFFADRLAGAIAEVDDEYVFTYDASYLAADDATSISVTLPLRDEPYRSKTMLPFFDGLIPEGWLLDIAVESWKVDARDRMGLLLTLCGDAVGAVHVREVADGAD